MTNYNKIFFDFLADMDFSLEKEADGFHLHDNQGANLNGIEGDAFDSAKDIIERLDVYINDYYFDSIADWAEELGIDAEVNGSTPYTAEEWLQWKEENPNSKLVKEADWYFQVFDMIVNGYDKIDLEAVVNKTSDSNDNKEIKESTSTSAKNNIIKEISNNIYDTLMGNTNFHQFPWEEVEDPELDLGTATPTITFSYKGLNFKISIKAGTNKVTESYTSNKSKSKSKSKNVDLHKYHAQKLSESLRKFDKAKADETIARLKESLGKGSYSFTDKNELYVVKNFLKRNGYQFNITEGKSNRFNVKFFK